MIRGVLTLVLWLCAELGSGMAHPLDPALLEIRERGDAPHEVIWQVPDGAADFSPLHPVLPKRCTSLSSPTAQVSGIRQGSVQRWTIDCGSGSFAGERMGVQGLRERKTDALIRVHLAAGCVRQTVVRDDQPFYTIPACTGWLVLMRDHLLLGWRHSLTGLDHWLFGLGLLLLLPSTRRLLWTITSFTIGHSVTLSLVMLGVVEIPPATVEALIAVSLFAIAVQLTRHPVRSTSVPIFMMHGMPWVMTLAFGLLHGLGFPGVLAQLGLLSHERPSSLFFVHMGIGFGQLLVVFIMLVGRAMQRWLPIALPQASELIPAYVIGSLTTWWIFQRIAAIF